MSVGEVVYPPAGRFGPRWQPNVQLVLVYSGRAVVTVDERPPLVVPARSVCLLLPGHREDFRFAEDAPTRHGYVQFKVGELSGALRDRLTGLPATLPISSALDALVAEGIAIARTPLSAAQPLLAALGAAAVWRYVAEGESGPRAEDDPVERVRRFIHAHAGDQGIDLQRLAGVAHVSGPYLVRRFRAVLGVTPMAYLWQRRLAIGIDLLTSTGLPVGEIATRSGFASVYHFSRRVKAHTGLPPSEVRRERWSGASPSAQRTP